MSDFPVKGQIESEAEYEAYMQIGEPDDGPGYGDDLEWDEEMDEIERRMEST